VNTDDEEWINEMMRECSMKHGKIDEGLRTIIHGNACRHFKGFGNFVVGRSVVVTEVIDQIGDTHLVSFASPSLKQWEVLGMMEYVIANMMKEDWN